MKASTRKRGDAVGIVGLGLMGGSLARALRRRFPRRTLIGIESDGRTRARARASGIFDAILPLPSEALASCGIVVLGAPVPAILRLLAPVSRRMGDGAILTDLGAVKAPIAAAARRNVRPAVAFVGAHPMFGGETGGFAASRADLWKDGTVAVCTEGDPRAVSEIARFHGALGARVVFCRAAEHDAAVAAVSHLPYVVASALSLTACDADPLARRLAGRGFADSTRLAGFAFEIQGRAAAANGHLGRAARDFRRHLAHLLGALHRSEGNSAFERARAARRVPAWRAGSE